MFVEKKVLSIKVMSIMHQAWQHILRFIKLTDVDIMYHKRSIHNAVCMHAQVAKCFLNAQLKHACYDCWLAP